MSPLPPRQVSREEPLKQHTIYREYKSSAMSPYLPLPLPLLLLLLLPRAMTCTTGMIAFALAYSPPASISTATTVVPMRMGMFSRFIRPRNVRYVKSHEYDNERRGRLRERGGGRRGGRGGREEFEGEGEDVMMMMMEEDALTLAGRFFVDAFWYV
jgi:hypothetical protein